MTGNIKYKVASWLGVADSRSEIESLKIMNRELCEKIKALEDQANRMESRLINYYRNRWDTIDNLADYLVNAELPGDYMEFGVFMGTTFAYTAKIMAPLFKDMRFLAFDSFQGLPKPTGIDAEDGFCSGFHEGQFACSMEEFSENLAKEGVDLQRVKLIKGWFDESLNDETRVRHDIRKAAAIWIDCDLYESTVPILDFITPLLSVGTVILFDDWRCFRNLPHYGQQRACREWLSANPKLKLNDFISFGFHGMSFTVGAC